MFVFEVNKNYSKTFQPPIEVASQHLLFPCFRSQCGRLGWKLKPVQAIHVAQRTKASAVVVSSSYRLEDPTSTNPCFRTTCQIVATRSLDQYHLDFETVFPMRIKWLFAGFCVVNVCQKQAICLILVRIWTEVRMVLTTPLVDGGTDLILPCEVVE